jgi:hypothetical protein
MLKVKDIVNQRSQLPAWLRLRTVSSINFINFELHRKQLVDIRKEDDIPPESRKDEYYYVPMPANLIPPIGRNYLMHTYHHPEDADNYTLCLDRFPKRKTGRLQHTDGRPVPGWGIHFTAGLDQTKLCFVGLFCTVCSASFGIIWSVVRNDVQGGFGVSAYMMALLVFGVGSIQAVAM